jgi:branched-chain amino acid transport system permease protein
VFRAIREDEVLAQTLGIDTARYKLLAFALSSGFAGLAGGLYEGLRFVGVVYNLVAVGFVIMVFVIFFPRGLAGFGRSA